MDAYGTILGDYLFPAWEQLRGRNTTQISEFLQRSQWASLDELAAIQAGFLKRLVHHAYRHTSHYRQVMDQAGISPERIRSVDDLQRFPVLDRDGARASVEARMSDAPPAAVVKKQTSGTTGQPMIIAYNQESRIWRDADRWRGYGWAGYRMGKKALHYWAVLATQLPTRQLRAKLAVDRYLKRDLYLDSTPRGDTYLAGIVEKFRKFGPDVMLAYSQAGGDLARYINRTGSRSWGTVPVLCGAERVWPHDRAAMEEAFGPAVFETYGCREFMLIGSECEAHDGLHVSMEKLVVELLVREPDGRWRTAAPGETGEIIVTDLHNLAAPMIRYQTGDQAIARASSPCACGRTLHRLGPIEGRITETLRDGSGNRVSGLIFSILFVSIAQQTAQFQAVQKKTGELVLRVVPQGNATVWDPAAEALARSFVAKYLPGTPFQIEVVQEIPLTTAGKRRLVVVE